MTANSATSMSLTGLINGTYKMYTADVAGNLSAASASSGSIGVSASQINAAPYSLGAGKGYLIKAFSYNSKTWAVWSSDNNTSQDYIGHTGNGSYLDLVGDLGFGDGTADLQVDNPNTVTLGTATIKLLSTTTNGTQGSGQVTGDMLELYNALIATYGSGSAGLSALGWADFWYWSSQTYSGSSSHYLARLSDGFVSNGSDSNAHYAVFQVL